MEDLLPDSRLKDRRQFVATAAGPMIPTFCANCGRAGRLVYEQSCTFDFWLCNPCFDKCGHLTVGMVIPDVVFFEKMKQEQLDAHGRFLAERELLTVVEADASPLATLIKERPTPHT